MAFWLAAAFLTILATASIAVPLLRAPEKRASALDFDRELYRARIGEIDADLELGRIGRQEAEAAKAEEGRKLIALSAAPEETGGQASARLAPLALVAVIVFVPATALLFYSGSGVPSMPDMAIASRDDRDLSRQSIAQLLDRAEAQLAKNPNDVRGWTVVAPVYLRLGRTEDAVTAWRNALRLKPGDPDLAASLGETLTIAAGGVVTEEARRHFQAVLGTRPQDAKSRFYLAIALGQEGEFAKAADAWRALIADSPSDAPWLPVARAQLQAVAARSGTTPDAGSAPAAQAPGPTAGDIEAAGEMSAAERQAMIETMVAGLAEKLKDDPRDRAGWRRLIRSYAVLGKSQEATRAIAEARAHFPDDAEFLAELDAMAKPAEPSGATQ